MTSLKTNRDILELRLHNQLLINPRFKTPAEIVCWMGAMQAQDYPGAKWAISQRSSGLTETDVDQALADGTIIRTHLMRPTWHFVHPNDIRWLLKLTAPRVKAIMASYNRKLGLNGAAFERSNTVLAKALTGGKHLTRAELAKVLKKSGVLRTGDSSQKLGFIVMEAELDAIICSGPRVGKQFTYALFEERVPKTQILNRGEALVELAKRYFTSHGPATIRDFVWWSGLTVADTKSAIEKIEPRLAQETVEGKTYWFSQNAHKDSGASSDYFFPAYDEYFIAYKDRSQLFEPKFNDQVYRDGGQIIFIDNTAVGTWRRTLTKNTVVVTPFFFGKPNQTQRQAFNKLVHDYGKFLNLKAIILDNS